MSQEVCQQKQTQIFTELRINAQEELKGGREDGGIEHDGAGGGEHEEEHGSTGKGLG